jgi:hypothetical protein
VRLEHARRGCDRRFKCFNRFEIGESVESHAAPDRVTFAAVISRRTFIKSAAAATAAIPLIAHAQDADEKIVLCAPLTHSDWMLRPNMVWGIDGVKHMLDACKACGWSHVMWRVFDAGQATYASKLLKCAQRPDVDNIFNPLTDEGRAAVKKLLPNLTEAQAATYLKQMAAMDYEKFDALAAATEYGHSIGLKIHAWATINEDDHGWGWASEFSKAHPEFRWVRRDGRVYKSQLSFAFPEVREYKLGLIKELIAYPIDGLFIDWIRTGDIRDNPQTNPDGVADSGYEKPNIEAFKTKHSFDPQEVANDDDRWVRTRAQPQTIFMREMRKLTKLPIAAMVGHPWHYRGTLDKIDGSLRGLLLDVKTWADEALVDSFVPAGYYRDGGNAEMAYRSLRDETGGKVDVWTYSWVPESVSGFEGDYQLARKLGAKQMLLWEADYIDGRANAAELKAAMTRRAKV